MVSTTYCTILSSAFMNVISVYPPVTQDKMLAALSGAAIVATSMGMIMKVGATTGGIDIVVKTLKRKYPYMKTGKFYLIIDACVVIVSAILFRDIEIALYATIAIITSSFMMDLVLYGRDGAKMIYIIRDKADAIAERLLREVGIGVTFVNRQMQLRYSEKAIRAILVRDCRAVLKCQEKMFSGVKKKYLTPFSLYCNIAKVVKLKEFLWKIL